MSLRCCRSPNPGLGRRVRSRRAESHAQLWSQLKNVRIIPTRKKLHLYPTWLKRLTAPGCGTSFRLFCSIPNEAEGASKKLKRILASIILAPDGVSRVHRKLPLCDFTVFRASRWLTTMLPDTLVCERVKIQLIKQVVKVGAQSILAFFAQPPCRYRTLFPIWRRCDE